MQMDSLPAEPPGEPKNIAAGSLSLLQGIFPTQEPNWDLLHCRWIFTSWATREFYLLGKGLASSNRKLDLEWLKQIGIQWFHTVRKLQVDSCQRWVCCSVTQAVSEVLLCYSWTHWHSSSCLSLHSCKMTAPALGRKGWSVCAVEGLPASSVPLLMKIRSCWNFHQWILFVILARDLGFPYSSVSKESAGSVGDPGLIPGSGRSPGEGNGNPLQYSCLENLHGQRSLAGYSPRGSQELDMT